MGNFKNPFFFKKNTQDGCMPAHKLVDCLYPLVGLKVGWQQGAQKQEQSTGHKGMSTHTDNCELTDADFYNGADANTRPAPICD